MAEQHQHHSPLIRALLGHQATLSTRLHDAAAKKDYERAGRAYVERQETRVLLKVCSLVSDDAQSVRCCKSLLLIQTGERT